MSPPSRTRARRLRNSCRPVRSRRDQWSNSPTLRRIKMPVTLEGSCRCGAVCFSVESHAPQPYQLCYCSICRKTAGGGGFAINLSAVASTMKLKGKRSIGVYRAEIERDGHCETSTGERNFCRKCGTALWLYDPTWPELIHPFA